MSDDDISLIARSLDFDEVERMLREPDPFHVEPKPFDEDSVIAAFIAQHGVTRCPTAFAAPSESAEPTPEDAAAHAARGLDPSGDAWRQRKRRNSQSKYQRSLAMIKSWQMRKVKNA